LVGVARNIGSLEGIDSDELKRRQNLMLDDDEFSQERLSEGLAGKERLRGRLEAAVKAFAGA
jgi:hypothetical protein